MSERPTVVLLHGLGRTARSLGRLRRDLEKRGYPTWSRTYPSRRLPVEELASLVAGWIRDEVPEGPIVGVSHSLGGVLARHMSDHLPWDGLVMLAPPNAGSRVAAALGQRRGFRRLLGPALSDLGDPARWPPPPAPCAVIAGTRGPTLGSPPSWVVRGLGLLPQEEPNDGTVAVDETHLDGMTDFAEVPASHTWLMNHPRTRDLVVRFLERRSFEAAE